MIKMVKGIWFVMGLVLLISFASVVSAGEIELSTYSGTTFSSDMSMARIWEDGAPENVIDSSGDSYWGATGYTDKQQLFLYHMWYQMSFDVPTDLTRMELESFGSRYGSDLGNEERLEYFKDGAWSVVRSGSSIHPRQRTVESGDWKGVEAVRFYSYFGVKRWDSYGTYFVYDFKVYGDDPTCVAETDDEYCDRLGFECGTIISDVDNCGNVRTGVDCNEGCEVVCEDDLDCGEPVCAGEPNYCGVGDDIYQDYDVFVCENAGGYDSYCSSYVAPWFIRGCDDGCLFGSCVDEPECVEDVVNGSWSAWENVGGCVDDWVEQTRSRVEYDANDCGVFDEIVYTDSKDVNCSVSCVEDVVFGNWSEWSNESGCVDGLVDRIRTRVEYDVSSCGDFVEVVHEEFGNLSCSVDECEDDLDCDSDYDDRYCVGDDIHERSYDFSCEVGVCVANVSDEFVRECSDDCDDGRCESDGGSGDRDYNDVSYYDFVGGLDDVSSAVVIDLGGDVDEGSFWWVWVLLLVVGILILVVAIVLVMRN